jgi:thiol-disulfide isomerase/thioredoxin
MQQSRQFSTETFPQDLKNLTKLNLLIFGTTILILLFIFISWSSIKKSINSVKKLITEINNNNNNGGRSIIVGSPAAALASKDSGQESSIIVTLYTASWCPICVMFAPKWLELESTIQNNQSLKKTIQLIKKDCSDDEKRKVIIQQLKLKDSVKFPGYPTVTIRKLEDNVEEIFDVSSRDSVEKIIENINKKLV